MFQQFLNSASWKTDKSLPKIDFLKIDTLAVSRLFLKEMQQKLNNFAMENCWVYTLITPCCEMRMYVH